MGALACDLDSRAAHFASKCSASWELLVGWGSIGQLIPTRAAPPVPLCVTVAVVEGKELCRCPLTTVGDANVVVGKPPGRVGKAECWVPHRAPIPTPIAAPPPVPAAVQNTLATICDGVMPTTGTLALGYVMLLARVGMYCCIGTNAGWRGCWANMPTGAGVTSNAIGKGCMEVGREPGGGC